MNVFMWLHATPTEAHLSDAVPTTKNRTKTLGVNYTGILVQGNYTPALRILDSVWIDYLIYHTPSVYFNFPNHVCKIGLVLISFLHPSFCLYSFLTPGKENCSNNAGNILHSHSVLVHSAVLWRNLPNVSSFTVLLWTLACQKQEIDLHIHHNNVFFWKRM